MNNEVIVEFIPAARWYQRATWKLKSAYKSHNGEVIVPVGFISDGASIPFFGLWLFSPTGSYFAAAIVHDYVLADARDWNKANHQFWAELNALGVNSWRKAILLTSVRIYYRWLRLTGRD